MDLNRDRTDADISINLQDVDLLKQEVTVVVGDHLCAVHQDPVAPSVTCDAHLKRIISVEVKCGVKLNRRDRSGSVNV